MKVSLIGLALDAPLMAALQRWPKKIHAVTMDGVVDGFDRQTFHSACGLRGLRLVRARSPEGEYAALWPPKIRTMPLGHVRCRECWEATGKKRPRTEYRKAS